MGLLNNPDRLLRLQRQLAVLTLSIILLFVLFQIGVFFADLLRILAISFTLSYLLINVVDWLDRYVRNRALAIVIVYVALLGVIAVSAVFVIPALVYQVSQLISTTVDQLPQMLQRMNEALQPLQERFHQSQIDIKVIDVVTTFVAQLPKPDPGALVTRVTDVAMSTMQWSMYSISISIITFYFLLDGHNMKESIIALFPRKSRVPLDVIARDMDRTLQSFFKGQLVLGGAFGLVMLAVYYILNVQYALLLSAFLAICEILPVIGPPIGFAPAILAVAVHGTILPGARFAQIILLTAIFLVLQQVKDSVVAPRYIGNVIGMHPVMIFVAIMIGARLDGMLGIILSLPAACAVNVLFNHLQRVDSDTTGEADQDPVVAEVVVKDDAADDTATKS